MTLTDLMPLLPILLAALLLAVLTTFFLLWPLRGRHLDRGQSVRDLGTRVYRERLQELNADLSTGRLDADGYAQLKVELDRNLLADQAGLVVAASAPRPLRGLALALLILLPATSLGLYYGYFLNPGVAPDLGNQMSLRDTIDQVLAGKEPSADGAKHSLQDFMRALQRRVQEEPGNADAWMTLGLGFLQARDLAPAKVALARAAELRPDDQQVVMTYVQASIMAQQGEMDPVARRLLARILHDQPDHQGALLMLALGSLRGGDKATAREVLTRLQTLRAAMPASAGAGDDDADARIAMLLAQTEEAPAATVSGPHYEIEVTLAPELARVIPADATLFVFARSSDGMPMPVAVARRAGARFPLRLTLSDADSLQPSRLLSQQKQLILQARISRTGVATPSPGDWEAVAVPVQAGSASLVRLRISETR